MKSFHSVLAAALSGVLLLAVAAASQAQLYFSRDNENSGLYTLSTTNGAATHIGLTGVTSNTVGLAESPDPTKLYGSSWTELHLINTDGSGFVNLGATFQEGLAYDPFNDKLYGSINGSFSLLSQVNGSVIANLAAPGADIEGLAYGHGGVYGLPRFDTRLFFYNPIGNSWSIVGNTGVNWDLAGLAYDPIKDVLYGKGFQDSLLYRINPLTAQTSVVGDTGIVEGGGLAFIGIPEPTTLTLWIWAAVAPAFVVRRRHNSTRS
jgi:hypothetical protein